ncbi:MAG: hypothetical protein A2Z06_04475 [Candidatus Glassbacteria bacterium RBG_16_58_8]|uniref:Membrane protein insertase YidC n=1 Tax=Candidatus Glassbacteria bacterium RBG_16_58_8 TaxID=1817866 RepID=A0A1F5YD18_9BACT|nr:MAG: hypothetical protein A2Z06_04475 [Candidatus Glassbacteria bacterium RBG_16_58_8]
MRVTAEKDTLDLSELSFQPSAFAVDAVTERRTLLLVHAIGERDTISLQYTFVPGSYVIGLSLTLPGMARARDLTLHIDLLPRLLPTEVDSVENDIKYFGTVMGKDEGGVETVEISDLGEGDGEMTYREGPFLWAGVKNKYFVAALISKPEPLKGAVTKGSEARSHIGLTALLPGREGGWVFAMDLYIGPQDYHRLSSLGVGMEDITEYGWWIIRPFTRLIVIILLWMHGFIANYGVVILCFAVLTRVAFYPLTQKSMKATQGLQKIQPLLKEARERHKKEPQKLQQETMRLYKEHKVSPLGGCLPMLLQMPVLWALFYVFQMTIEFRGSGFIWWIEDLSAPDSPPVLPIVMGLSMFLQQKLSPQSADPKMATMMYIMPVVLTFVFIGFPSGLVLYWTASNILAIAQQLLVRNRPAPEKAVPPVKSA